MIRGEQDLLVSPFSMLWKSMLWISTRDVPFENTSAVDKVGNWDVEKSLGWWLSLNSMELTSPLPTTGEKPIAHPRSAASVSRRMLLVLLSRTTLPTSLP